MFCDDAFKEILEDSPFSTEAVVSLEGDDGSSFPIGLKGMFFSGSYGEDDLSKGYTTDKTVERQFFRVSLLSLPEGVEPKGLNRRTVTIDGLSYTVVGVDGNRSGILTLVLAKGAKA